MIESSDYDGISVQIIAVDHIRVRLRSRVRRGLIVGASINFTDATGLPVRIEVTAGALAEYLDEKYGDRYDPRQCAQAAVYAFHEVVTEYQQRVNERFSQIRAMQEKSESTVH